MKLSFLSALLMALFMDGQQNVTYYDYSWQETGKENAVYYSKFTLKDSLFKVEDYLMTGQVFRTGYRTNIDSKSSWYRTGKYEWFDSAGHKVREGSYNLGKRVGIWRNYYTGTDILKDEMKYSSETDLGYHIFYDSVTQKITEKDTYLPGDVTREMFYNGADSELTEIKYKNEHKSFVKTEYYGSGKVKKRVVMESGDLKSMECYSKKGDEIDCDTSNKNPGFKSVEVMPKPRFVLNEYLSSNIHYPKYAMKKNIEGRVIVGFIIDEDGTVSEAKVVRGIGGGCDEEALRVVAEMPLWDAGSQNGKVVRVSYTLPIKFRLQ